MEASEGGLKRGRLWEKEGALRDSELRIVRHRDGDPGAQRGSEPGMLDLGFQTVDLDNPAPLSTSGFIVVTQISLCSPSRVARYKYRMPSDT